MKRRIFEIITTIVLSVILLFFLVIAGFQMYERNEEINVGNVIVPGMNSQSGSVMGAALSAPPVGMGNYIGIVSAGNFAVIDKNARMQNENTFVISDPLLHGKGNFCVVASYGGKEVRLYEKGEEKTVLETEGEILQVVVNANGFFAVAEKQIGYNAVITVYRSSGEAIYRYSISKNTFVDMDISANNRKLLISEADLESGTIGTSVVIAEINRNGAESSFKVDGNLYVKVHFNKDGSFVGVGNGRCDIYRADEKLLGSIEYNDKTLTGAQISDGDVIYLSFDGVNEGETGASVLEIYSKTGKKKGSCIFDDLIEYICVNNSYCAVAHGDKADVVKVNGKIKKSVVSPSPVRYAMPFKSGNEIVVFSGGNTTIMK